MNQLISDPEYWAIMNGYYLENNRFINGFTVSSSSGNVGILQEKNGLYQFHSLDNSINSDFERMQAHSFFTKQDLIQPLSGEELKVRDNKILIPDHIDPKPYTGDTSNPYIANGNGTFLKSNLRLPFAAPHYRISKNIRDYIFIPIPGIISDIPNTNGDSLSKEEMLRFYPHLGVQMYETFIGKPTFVEHENTDITKARGLIFDAFIAKVKKRQGNHLKIGMLSAWDIAKDPKLCESLCNGNNAFSIGFFYSSYTCSYCGAKTTKAKYPACNHTNLQQKPYLLNEKIVYRLCHNAEGFELSSVQNPAFVVAIGDKVMRW